MARFHRLVDKSENTFAKWAGTWDVEIVAVTFSCLTLIAMIILLMAGNDKAVWSGVTLNTYVSILATASKLSALFALSSAIGQTKWNTFRQQSGSLLEFEAIDLASRGALGCIQLLCLTRKVAFVGALTFILAFAFDPFTQQLIQTKFEMVYTNHQGVSAPITTRYSGGSQLLDSMEVVGPHYTPLLDPSVDYAMQSSILSGLVQDQSIIAQQLLVGCPSGNCTWPPMKSLAICTRCANVESMLKRSRSVTHPVPYMLWLDSALMIANTTRFALPNGLYIENNDGANLLRMTTSGTGLPEETNQMKDINTLIWSMAMLKAQPNATNATATWPDLPIQAIECALYYCVKEYDLAVSGNQIKQNSSELADFKRQRNSWRPFSTSINGTTSSVTLNNTEMENSISWNIHLPVNRTDLMLSDQKTNFNISFDAVRSISQYFWTNFWFNTTGASQSSTLNGFYIDFASPGPYFKPSIMELLYESENFTEKFNTLAHSMTNAIRMRKADNEDVHGKLGRPVTKYRIEWPWIAMPILIVLATIVQLIVTIRNSRSRPILKSSILAVLSRGPYLNGVFDGAETVKDLRDAAAHENVSLFDLTEPMISPRHAKKFSISSSYMSVSSPSLTVDGRRTSPLIQVSPEHGADGDAVGHESVQTNTRAASYGLGIMNEDGSPVISPRRAFLSSGHARSMSASADNQESPLLREMQQECPHFRDDERRLI